MIVVPRPVPRPAQGTSTSSKIFLITSLGGDLLGLGFVGEDHAVTQNIHADRLDVVGCDVRPVAQETHRAFAASARKIVARGLAPYWMYCPTLMW